MLLVYKLLYNSIVIFFWVIFTLLMLLMSQCKTMEVIESKIHYTIKRSISQFTVWMVKKGGHGKTALQHSISSLSLSPLTERERALEGKRWGWRANRRRRHALERGFLSLTHSHFLSNLEVLYFIFSCALNMASFSQNSFLAAPNREIWRPHCDRLTRRRASECCACVCTQQRTSKATIVKKIPFCLLFISPHGVSFK